MEDQVEYRADMSLPEQTAIALYAECLGLLRPRMTNATIDAVTDYAEVRGDFDVLRRLASAKGRRSLLNVPIDPTRDDEFLLLKQLAPWSTGCVIDGEMSDPSGQQKSVPLVIAQDGLTASLQVWLTIDERNTLTRRLRQRGITFEDCFTAA